ncbi:methyltransferase domain-containing protein [Nonomuraea sp. B12E4]|uniref:class I SAM-dependent methyltransferase n=1 Tax=Nonomuraea sp. B12E4 TaxID=3153564 RepID=UPI00325D7AC7
MGPDAVGTRWTRTSKTVRGVRLSTGSGNRAHSRSVFRNGGPGTPDGARARAKLAGTDASILLGDAAQPPVGDRRFDVLLARHLLWATIPTPQVALAHWKGLLRPGGRLVLIEGRWSPWADSGSNTGSNTGSGSGGGLGGDSGGGSGGELPWAVGVRAVDLVTALRPLVAEIHVDPLPDPMLWGKEIDDERYAVVALT